MSFKPTDCFTVVGTRGTGKSYLARQINELFPRSVIIDPTNDWKSDEIYTSFDKFAESLANKKNSNKKEFRIIFRFNPDSENKEEILNHVLRLCYHFKNIQVVIDEVQLFTHPGHIPKYLENLLFLGRHQGISVMAITQRPARLNKSILSQSTHVYAGQLHERNDIKAIADFLNEDAKKLITLPKRTFIYFSPEFGKKIIKT